jgi:ketosteroid isomerase-like protein
MPFDGNSFVQRFGAVWNDHDVDAIVAQFTDDVIFEASFGPDPWGKRATGKAAARALVEEVFDRIPDVRFDTFRHYVNDEIAVVESLTTGTPKGGPRFEVHLVDILTLRDGKVAAKRSYRKMRS